MGERRLSGGGKTWGKGDCREAEKPGGQEIVGRRKNMGERRLSGGGKTGEIYCREVDEQGQKQYSDIGWD